MFCLGSNLYILWVKIKHFWLLPNFRITALSGESRLADVSRREVHLLMEAMYTTEDKYTHYKLMQKADQVLKDAWAAVEGIDSEAA